MRGRPEPPPSIMPDEQRRTPVAPSMAPRVACSSRPATGTSWPKSPLAILDSLRESELHRLFTVPSQFGSNIRVLFPEARPERARPGQPAPDCGWARPGRSARSGASHRSVGASSGAADRVSEVYRYLITRLTRRPFVGPVHGRSRAMEGAGDCARPESPPITLTSDGSWNPLTEPVSYVDAANRALSGRHLSVRSDVAIRRLKGGAYPADDVLFGYAADQAGLSGGYPSRTSAAASTGT